ncbi:MAG: hypothetical protein B7Y39_10015 [Bdellovibrio sp. 28-41-41]|nr:MAG: hypothetical protein B7Y39_10015 [Bdellovibrio sp. 28-41-41]
MDLNEVAIFIKVIQKGSFTGAALALDMPKSTVSTKISNLEKRLGISLITRSTRKIRLTPAGEAFFLRSTKAIDEINAAEIAVRSANIEPQGQFRITAPIDIGNTILPSLTAIFLKKFPKVKFDILLSDRRVDFLEDEVDLAIRAGELKDSSLIAKKVGEVVFQIYASPKYLKDKGEPTNPKELGDHTCVHFTPLSIDGWQLKSGKRSIAVALTEKIAVNNMSLAHGLALEGAGIALLPSFLCESEIKSGKLVPILRDWSSEIAPMHFVYPAQKYVPPTIKAFIEMSSLTLRNRFSFLGN